MRIRGEKRYGRGIVSQFQLRRSGVMSAGSGVTVAPSGIATVTVEVTDWQDDTGSGSPVTPTYTDAPVHGTIQYADVVHNLGSATALAVGYVDQTTGRRYSSFADQTYIDDATLRIWVMKLPANNIDVKVIA